MSVNTTLRLVDQMTAPIMAIQHAISGLENRFNAIEDAANIDTSSFASMQNQIDMADAATRALADTMQVVTDAENQMTEGQNNFNNSVNQGNSAANGLLSKIGAVVTAYASIQGIKTVIGLSDEVTQTIARLDMMNDGLQTTQDLQNKIYLSAQRSRAAYSDTANMIATLGTQAKNAFSSNDELITFAEQLNKTFVIAGTDAQGIQSTMYNLTQALASGVLRGQDLNAVMSNAQPILENVANYMGVGVENIREMAAEGQLSANVIKNAMLAAAEETNAKFEQMPMTFGQVVTSIKNQALMQFQPVLERLNQIVNSEKFQGFVDNIVNSFTYLAGVATWVIDLIINAVNALEMPLSSIAGWAQSAYDYFVTNWAQIAPVISFIASALAAVTGVLIAYKIAVGIAAIAQNIFNAALWASPITWIVITVLAIVVAIYALVAGINNVTGASISATGIIFGMFAWLGSVLANIFMGFLDLVFGVINTIANLFITIANFIGNVFNNPISSVIYLFQGLADCVLGILEKIASALDFVFGSNMADAVAGWRSGLKEMADAAVEKYAPNENYEKIVNELDLSVEKTLGWERFNNTDAIAAGYRVGENFENTITNFDPASLFPTSNIPNPEDYGSGTFDMSGIENSLANIDTNTSKQLDYSEEELKLWRDIAERDTINRFTTAEITVEFGDINNNVSSEMDLDGIVTYISDQVEEALFNVSEGVHT